MFCLYSAIVALTAAPSLHFPGQKKAVLIVVVIKYMCPFIPFERTFFLSTVGKQRYTLSLSNNSLLSGSWTPENTSNKVF